MDIKWNPERKSNVKKFADSYAWFGLKFPVPIKDIGAIETKNDVLVNVLVVEDRDIYICRKGWQAEPNCRCDCEINLLLISEDNRWHYAAIKSLSRLLTSRNSKHGKQYFCNNCLQGFTQESSRNEHYGYCIDNETIRVEMPSKGSTVEFYDGQNQFKVPFMMYADFEVIQERVPGDPNEPLGKAYTQRG